MKKKLICAIVMMMAFAPVFGQNDGSDLSPVAQYGFEDEDGNLVIGIQYDEVRYFSEGLAVVGVKDGDEIKYGFINPQGNLVIPVQYDYVISFSEGLAAVMNEEGKWGFIDKTGKMVIPQQFDGAIPFSDGIASVYVGDMWDGKWGCIDKTGKMVIEPRYDEELEFVGAVAKASIDGKGVLVNREGKHIIESESGIYDFVFEDGLGCVNIEDKYGFFNEDGWVVEPQFEMATVLHGLGLVLEEESWGFLNKQGKWVIEMNDKEVYDAADDEGAMILKYDGKFGIVDDNGWKELPFEEMSYFSEGMAPVMAKDKWGFIDNMGKTVVKPKYEAVQEFSDGLAAVKVKGKWGYIDTTGKMVIQAKYDEADPFYEGTAEVRIGDELTGETKIIDKSGKVVE